MAVKAVEVANADRMMIRVAASDRGLEVSFADGCAGLIGFDEILEIRDLSRLAGIELPNPYEIRLHSVEGESIELPWDFARHFCQPEYRPRIEAVAAAGRRSMGERIRHLRETRAMTQEDLARTAGIGRVTLVRIENGHRSPRYETLVRLAAALGQDPGELLA